MLDLIVQIVNYKTKKYLPNCIGGVMNDLKDFSISYKILILDNNSGDDLKDLESKYIEQEVEFYYSDKNLGFGGGHNFLAKRAESKYILILNPDIKFIGEKTISRLLSLIKNSKETAVVGPLLMNEGGVQHWDHGELKGFKSWIAMKTGSSYWKSRSEAGEVAWVSGAFFLILREVFYIVEGFDDKFFLYKEEEDLCLRIRKLGYKVIYSPLIKAFHYGSVVASKDIYFDASDKYFYQKHISVKGRPVYLDILKKIRKKILGY